MNPFYITTTLPYVNSEPHIGFALEIIQADAIARYQRSRGREVIFNTGTDEHGLKIYRKAQERGITAQEFCDEYAAKFDELKGMLNLTYDRFIRTTDAHHKAAAQEFWRRCAANGDIYKKNYQVKYCVGCELEKTDTELEEGRCPIHPNMEIEFIDEENYFFRFSKYQEALLNLYRERPDFVLPAHRLTEIVKFTERGLQDFSVSRLKEKMPWGVPVPDDPDHVMYVWFDALVNYVSTLGWPEAGEFDSHWPGVQIAGKDNLRQQSNMWQGMLLSAGLPPSQQILIHGFITAEGQKMSKSLGNVVSPKDVVARYGTDALRYYLLREIPTAEDGDFSQERFEALYRDELQNTIGNLVRRVVAMTVKYLEGRVDAPEAEAVQVQNETDAALKETVQSSWQRYHEGMERFNLKAAVEAAVDVAREGNAYVEQNKPWALAKAGDERLPLVLANLVEVCKVFGKMLEPILPEAAERILQQVAGETVVMGDPLFPSLEGKGKVS